MPKHGHLPEWQRALIALAATAGTVTVVAALYWARTIFIPLAMAVFLTFVLAPVVAWFQRKRLGRTPAVVLTVGSALLLTLGSGALIARQLAGLSNTITEHDRAEAFKQKVAAIKTRIAGDGGSQIGQFVDDVTSIIAPRAVSANPPQRMIIESGTPQWLTQVQTYITPATEVLGQGAFAFVLTVYMLLRREDLRNRMIRLIGHGSVTTTTKAVDDASTRISRYLLTQFLLNAAFGVVITLGLFALGLDYALLWGFIAFVMRYVPYVGTWIGVLPPTLFSLATAPPDSWQPLGVFTLFVGLELLCNNIFEPLLYGPSMGLSEVAQLVAAGFWAFLWGPIGLILSGPLTVVLLILGKYVRKFEYLAVLLGDEPALEPKVAFYQRLTARDQDEAAAVALKEATTSSPEAVYDAVIVPAVCLAKRDYAEGALSDQDLGFAVRAAAEVAEEVAEVDPPSADAPAGDPPTRIPLVLCPAKDDADAAAVGMLARLLDPVKWDIRVTAVDTLASELLTAIGDRKPAAVVIGAVPPGGLSHSRYLVARIKRQFPGVKLVVGRWGRCEEFPDDPEQPGVTGADWVDCTLAETRKRLTEWHPVFAAGEEKPARAGAKREAVGTAGAPS